MKGKLATTLERLYDQVIIPYLCIFLLLFSVLPNEIPNSNPTLRKVDNPRRNFLQELIFPRKILADMRQTFSSLTKNEDQRRQPDGENSDNSQVISPRSSGYWSEIEYCSDQNGNVSQSEDTNLDNNNNDSNNKNNSNNNNNNNCNGNKNTKENSLLHEDKELESKKRNHFHDENALIKETNADINKPTKTDFLLSGHSYAWQNTKTLFSASSSCCVAQDGTRRDSQPDWRKYFDSHSNIRHSSLKVTYL